jgi:ABC-2 type transport system ATP-binding protein
MNPMIELNGIVKTRGSFTLGPVDLTLESGWITAVVGPNGSGKSTLFRTIMDLLHPEQGEVRLFGRTMKEHETEVKAMIGWTSDTLHPLDEGLTIEQWVQFVARWYPAWNETLWQRLSERLEIAPDKRFKECSTGMLKRISFALSLAHDPKLLLLDEPSSGLDPFAWRIMMDEIRMFMEQEDRGVVIATHIMEEVRRLADWIVFMHDGRVVGMFEKDELLSQWKTFWMKGDPAAIKELPGVVEAEEEIDGSIRFVTKRAKEAERRIRAQGLDLIEMRAVELEDILWNLMKNDKQTKGA